MKIYSKEYDYYDSAMETHGENIRYLRKPEIIAIDGDNLRLVEKNIIRKHKGLILPFKTKDNVRILTIFFCGKMYFCFTKGVIDLEHFYDLNKLKNSMGEGETNKNKYMSLGFWKERNIESIIKNEMNMNEYYNKEEILEIHKKYNSPIVVVGNFESKSKYRVSIYKDCLLGCFKFFKVFDVYTAFQEIEMFLGSGVLKGVGINEDGNVQISDEYMIKQKGFDDCSFRRCEDTRPRKQKKGKVKH